MKVGILTFIQSNNYGTVLQAYAMQKNLEGVFGEEAHVEIVNIDYLYREIKRKMKSILSRNLVNTYNNFKRNLVISQFISNNINLSQKRILIRDIEKSANQINQIGYDLIVCGSDEIWSSKIPLPSIYYAPGISAIKVSCAASANRSDFSNMSDQKKEVLAKLLKEFKLISVRDSVTRDFVTSLGIKNVLLVSDPAFVFSFPSFELHQHMVSMGIRMDKPTIGMMLFNKDIAKSIVSKYGDQYEIVNLYGYVSKAKNIIVTPIQFVNIFKYFTFVVTDSFHGTVFSIKNHANFISVDTDKSYRNTQSKMSCLLAQHGLMHRYIKMHGSVNYNNVFDKVNKLMTQNESYDSSNIIEESKRRFNFFADELRKVLS